MDLLRAVFNHLVLPHQVPGGQDSDVEAISHDVLKRIIHACETIDAVIDSPWSEAFQSLRASLDACLSLNSGRLERSTMLEHFSQLEQTHMLILHVVEQNSALLVRRDTCNGQQCIIEAFETSATTERVLAADGALQWDFPGRSVQVPLNVFANVPFQESLAAFLEQASMESLHSLQANTWKANVSITETRDTTDPALVTHMLMPLLGAIGSHYQAPVLRKRVRDEVNIQGEDLPWRRLPFWLVLRVAAQRQLSLALGNERGRIGYKFLMCVLLCQLLQESVGKLSPELAMTLRAKICRRMAKLELDKAKVQSANAEISEPLFARIGPMIKAIVEEATAQVEATWERFKQETTRHIPKLPLRAPDYALRLSLSHSSEYFSNLLSSPQIRQADLALASLPEPLDKAVRQSQDFTNHIFRLTAMELRINPDDQFGLDTASAYEARCLQLAEQIDQVFTKVGTTYDSDPELMSAMLLTLFTLWVRLDKCVIATCPLLGDYRPAFSPELLDVLQLPTLSAMRRLHDIQTHLDQRQSRCRYGTILDKLDQNCLAMRYVAQSAEMRSLDTRIQDASNQARDAKEVEWKRECEAYDNHTIAISNGTCCCSWNSGRRDVRGCTKCWHWRVRNRMKMQIQEAFLPSSNPARAAVVFELAIPSYLAAYRNATWRILSVLAHPARPTVTSKAEIELRGCRPLQRYITADVQGISLASPIKGFTQTHYRFSAGRPPLSDVLLPFAARFELYDRISGVWVKDLNHPLTLQHLCGIYVPRGLQSTILQASRHPPPVVDGPSSYEIQANQSECPSDMSVHEFAAYQKLLGGKLRRWLNILVEMSSSNLNLSSEDSMRVLCQFAAQAGPQLPGDVFRAAHVIFKESAFVERLVEVIEKRLRSILTNWREHNCMELLITLSLRLWSLSSGVSRSRAVALLESVRDATLEWITRLRKEVRTAVDAGTAERGATYGLYAALLCRRTFTVYVELTQAISPKNLTSWIQASIALQENLFVDIDGLPQTLRRMFIRDAKMAYQIQPLLQTAIQVHPASAGIAITQSWLDSSDEVSVLFSAWSFLPPPNDRWITATVSEAQESPSFSQRVHCNIVEGHVLVNGKPRGKLPLEIRNSPLIKDMFGNQHLLTYPSTLPGMTHRLANFVHGQEVHFGLRDEQVVVRSRTKNGLLELVPKEVFSGLDGFDLPVELMDNCVHWLNLNTACLEVRRKPAIWIKRPRDWIVDIPGRQATRGGKVDLVDPRSDVFSQVAGIFRHFERPEKLTVFQPRAYKGKLSVELRHLDLSFYVNKAGLLECRQLKAEVDPNQDAGTWYGLDSKLILRDVVSGRRSIVVPLGQPIYQRRGIHVGVRIKDARDYGTYQIDEVVGRLSCPPEPRLVYTKALCHAVTSFCLPDGLTKRTGTEEAFRILRSGAAQPWIPLGSVTHPILKVLKSLSPHREYYPTEIKRLQKVQWDKHLTVTIQHDGYEPLVQAIMSKSNQLQKFSNAAAVDFDLSDPSHLRYRGEKSRLLYERPTHYAPDQGVDDPVYVPRDRRVTPRAAQVYEVAVLLIKRCPSSNMTNTLLSVLESYAVIGGFHGNDSLLPDRSPLISQIEDPINERWGDLVNVCRHADDQAPLLFRLGLLAFGSNADMDAVRSLAAFASVGKLKSIQVPKYSSFVNFKSRGRPSLESLQELIVPAHSPIKHRYGFGNELRDREGRNAQEHKELCEEEACRFVSLVLEQWPRPAAELSTLNFETNVLDVALALDKIAPEWERRRANSELESYTSQVQEVLDSLDGPWEGASLLEWEDKAPAFVGVKHGQPIIPLAGDLVSKPCRRLENEASDIHFETQSAAVRDSASSIAERKLSAEATELEGILARFASSPDALRQQYAEDLRQSLVALKKTDEILQPDAQVPIPTLDTIIHAKERAYNRATYHLQQISAALAANDPRSAWLQLSASWPCTSPTTVLELLRSINSYDFGSGMKEALVSYGLVITELQRLERIRDALLRDDKRMLDEELRNGGHQTWSPLELPDWLLMEIDSNMLIRAEQAAVAQAIIAPSSGENSLLQMAMGKGKTSWIVPMVIAVLANGKELSRLLVPKALLMQTAQMIQLRLGGLVGREIRHVPFSRKTRATPEIVKLYEDLHRDTRDLRGLILTSWENVLSYKLGGWQQLADGKLEAASRMIEFQGWLEGNCRDVLDECDVTLSVKTQLNYPSGSEMPVDGHPFRWQVAEELLGLVCDYVPTLQDRFSDNIDVLERPGSFPMLHLESEAENALHDRLLEDISAGRTMCLRLSDSSSSPKRRRILRQALLQQRFDGDVFAQAVNAFEDPQTASKILLTIRGILTNRLLIICLNKRWNVQYGLHPTRDPVAVPFEAKGVPSEQSEFGHPDVSILFTCLAFYYTGLSSHQFQQSLQHVLQSEDPAAQYDWWTSGCNSLPEALHHWNTVNVDDAGQIEELWQHLRLNRIVVNHYMNHFVFPAHARQFDIKLQASAWDLPLSSEEHCGARTTGFSGTNDNRMMLPLTIRQDDLPGLQQTSAEVLAYLLQPRNRGYQITTDEEGKRLTEADFLRQVHAKGTRILIDAGAYILEMDNRTLAKTWLAIDHEAKAAVYFGSDNRAWVHFRDETKNDIPLLATPFADNLGECLVYLDEAHTRGVDLKLPASAHGALTLALKQTKDYTMQAAMRLRQLGTTQSVTFFAPPDVDQSIKDFCRPATSARLDSSHVICWLLEQTCRANKDLQPLYAAQGLDFCRRTDAASRYCNFLADKEQCQRLLQVLQQAERQTLEQMYGGASVSSLPVATEHITAPQLQGFAAQLRRICSKSAAVQTGALEEVEQEREVQVQVEQERQVQKPPRYEALAFPGLHPTIAHFACTGVLETRPSTHEDCGVEQALVCMARSNVGRRYGVRKTGSRLFVSKEFGKTVVFGKGESVVDNFLRPVEWILWCPSTQTAVVIIPEEAELLIPRLRLSVDEPSVYLVAYAAPVTKAMACFNSLRYYSLPRLPTEHIFPEWFRIEIGILAGRLYIDLVEWDPVARYLRLPSEVDDRHAENDARPRAADTMSPVNFSDDNVSFLLEWLALRRKAQDILHTPVGYICTGRTLDNGHPLWQYTP
ncbi:hypothetical protein F4678DRAFT_455700 [Xylaria arbuscula]|nr:hypothetical protein F4678DRAFT_455700 [Xylaria arbuscula]